MRDRIIGAVGVLWGGFLLVRAYLQFARGAAAPINGAQILSLLLALLFVIGGAFYLCKPRDRSGADLVLSQDSDHPRGQG